MTNEERDARHNDLHNLVVRLSGRVADLEKREDILAIAVARAVEADPHLFSSRPCSTCRTITALIGQGYGCVLKAGR